MFNEDMKKIEQKRELYKAALQHVQGNTDIYDVLESLGYTDETTLEKRLQFDDTYRAFIKHQLQEINPQQRETEKRQNQYQANYSQMIKIVKQALRKSA